MSTYLEARRVGGGATLSNGVHSYAVSDWSPATGQVHGYRLLPGGGRGPYQQLPEGLAGPAATKVGY